MKFDSSIKLLKKKLASLIEKNYLIN